MDRRSFFADDSSSSSHPSGDCAEADRANRLRRRGLVTGAAALVAGLLATRDRSLPVTAADGNGLTIGGGGDTTNTFSTTTTLAGSATGAPGLRVTNAYATGGVRDAQADAIQGYAAASASGVFGRNDDPGGFGVTGVATNGYGVFGQSGNGPGVVGSSATGAGVSGITTGSYGTLGTATIGTGAGGISSTGYGLLGIATASNGFGLVAYSSATGGYGASLGGTVLVNGAQYVSSSAGAGYSLVAYASTSGYYAVEALGNTSGAHGLYATPGAGGVAAVLDGDVVVTGGLTVYGSYPKSAAVPVPDGSYRLLYCTEAPEPWFEDVGVANLVSGTASVAFDPVFAAVIVTGDYHVFLTPEADCNGLYVTGKTAAGFGVQEMRGGTSTLSFAWRVLARRGDIAGTRFAPFTPPHTGAVPPPPTAPTLSPGLPSPAPLPQAPAATPLVPGPPVTPVLPTQTATVVPMTSARTVASPTTAPTPTGVPAPPATMTPAPTATAGATSTSAATARPTTVSATSTVPTRTMAATTPTTVPALASPPRPAGTVGSNAPNATPAPH